MAPRRTLSPRMVVVPTGSVVISQVYGGGGNSGATLKNDFIELYNNTNSTVSLNGWSVQYASSAGTTWQVTNLSNVTLQPGQYYLVQEALGAGGTVNLPTPDATGTIAMSATAGKVALVSVTIALAGSCPLGGNVVDFVGFGSAANCFEGTAGTPTLSNTSAALRKASGTQDTDDNAADFATGAPAPRNTASPTVTPNPGGGGNAAGPVVTVTVTPNPGSATVGGTANFAATGKDASNVTSPTTFTWLSSDPAVATISASGVATALKVGATSITATSANNVTSAPVTLNVTAPATNITVSTPSTFASPIAGFIPVGFQAQVFASGTDAAGSVTNNSQTNWTSSNTAVATVSTGGVISGLSAGTAIVTATSKADGVTAGSRTITIFNAVEGAAARIGHNTDLGIPTDAVPSDDYLIARRQYTLSYNPLRGGPNWVSWNLDASHKGSTARCNCFSQDPQVAAFGFPAYDTNDWINGGVYSRGHMSPSADWANAEGDNAPTYYLSNMLPQNQTVNGGIWGTLESDLRTLASGNTEIYVVSGPIFTKNRSGAGIDGFGFLGSLTQPGKIGVPDSVFKIAIVMNSGANVGSVASTGEVQQVIAAVFPNAADGALKSTWQQYGTTINAIQQSTGYNFLSSMPEVVQCAIEQRACLPAPQPAMVPSSGNGTVALGSPIVLNTSGVDPAGANGPWRYVLDWGDGTSFTSTLSVLPTSTRPLARAKTYAAPGQYTVRLTLTGRNGVKGIQTFVVTVQ